MTALEKLKTHLEPGNVYRRSELLKHSNAVDRHLKQLQSQGVLKKLSGGLYYYPKKTKFGKVPAKEKDLITAFLQDSDFLIFSKNAYNSLGLSTTQLYNETIVYNHKRHGVFMLGNRKYRFIRKPFFPAELSKEFLLADFVNNEKYLLEGKDTLLKKIKGLLITINRKKLSEFLFKPGWKHAQVVLSPLFSQKENSSHLSFKAPVTHFSKNWVVNLKGDFFQKKGATHAH